jgi:hypothetical protein
MEENNDKDKLAKTKTISVSSTESLTNSDIICLTEQNNPNTSSSFSNNINNKQRKESDNVTYDDETLFDFTKTGAIPKNKTKHQLNSKSSLSSSTSSSLSSLISSVPSTFSSCSSNNLKSKKKNSSSTNSSSFTNDYWV